MNLDRSSVFLSGVSDEDKMLIVGELQISGGSFLVRY